MYLWMIQMVNIKLELHKYVYKFFFIIMENFSDSFENQPSSFKRTLFILHLPGSTE